MKYPMTSCKFPFKISAPNIQTQWATLSTRFHPFQNLGCIFQYLKANSALECIT